MASPLCSQLALVNPFIGSGGWAYAYGSLNPSAQVPYGALRLGPDTTDMVADISYRHFSGYNYDDKYIRAFSHTHLVGAGANDLGNVGLMPVRLNSGRSFDDEWKLEEFGFPSVIEEGVQFTPPAPLFWWSTMNKTLETAAPGRYSTYLIEPGITVELIALSSYAAMHHYTFNDEGTKNQGLVVDACHLAKLEYPSSVGCTNATLTVRGEWTCMDSNNNDPTVIIMYN
jgi:putative alpha-1,2-mannosidase